MNFLIIQENETENVFMMLSELFLTFQINFYHYKIAWRSNEWGMCY